MIILHFKLYRHFIIIFLCCLIIFTNVIFIFHFLPSIQSIQEASKATDDAKLSYSLEWYQIWGGTGDEFGYGITTDNYSNIYLSGSTNSYGAGYRDVFLIKYDSNGNRLWNTTWGGPDWELVGNVVVDKDNDVYVTGFMDGVGGYDGFYVKYNSNGIQYWNRTWIGSSTDGFKGISVDSFNNILLAGGIGISTGAILLVKYDPAGLQLWNMTWDGVDDDYGNSVAIDSSNNIYVVGETESFNVNDDFDALIVKFNSTGVQQWNRPWSTSEYDFGREIIVDAYDNFYLVGYTYPSEWDLADTFLAKYDSAGNQIWNRTWGLLWNDDFCSGVAVNGNESYITGYTYNSLTGIDTFLVKFDSTGKQAWNKTWNINQNEKGAKITIDIQENIYISGFIEYSSGLYSDAFILKYGIDSDNDELTDNLEINSYYTDPNDSDTDNDGLNDGVEVTLFMTNPKNWDSDGDGYGDGWEIQQGYDPLASFSNPRTIMILSDIIIVIAIMATSIITLRYFKKPKILDKKL